MPLHHHIVQFGIPELLRLYGENVVTDAGLTHQMTADSWRRTIEDGWVCVGPSQFERITECMGECQK